MPQFCMLEENHSIHNSLPQLLLIKRYLGKGEWQRTITCNMAQRFYLNTANPNFYPQAIRRDDPTGLFFPWNYCMDKIF